MVNCIVICQGGRGREGERTKGIRTFETIVEISAITDIFPLHISAVCLMSALANVRPYIFGKYFAA